MRDSIGNILKWHHVNWYKINFYTDDNFWEIQGNYTSLGHHIVDDRGMENKIDLIQIRP